ncbi:MAG: prkC 8, partial [Frankiales bacterium]|nr:prkC 8 [Frankiales bacterium]
RDEIAAAEPVPSAPLAPLARPPRRVPAESSRPRPGWLAPVAVGVVLLGTAGAGLALATGDDDPGTTTAGPTSSAPSSAPAGSAPTSSGPAEPSDAPSMEPTEPAPSRQASPSAAPSAGGGAVPAGWSTDTGSAGWTVALPPGYAQTRAGEYRQPATGRTLRVDSGPGKPDAVADREQQAADFAKRHPTYEQVRIDEVDYRGYEAADWEFTYEGLHVLNRVFVVEGTGYSLFFQTPQADFAAARADVDGILEAFQPAS